MSNLEWFSTHSQQYYNTPIQQNCIHLNRSVRCSATLLPVAEISAAAVYRHPLMNQLLWSRPSNDPVMYGKAVILCTDHNSTMWSPPRLKSGWLALVWFGWFRFRSSVYGACYQAELTARFACEAFTSDWTKLKPRFYYWPLLLSCLFCNLCKFNGSLYLVKWYLKNVFASFAFWLQMFHRKTRRHYQVWWSNWRISTSKRTNQ